jgi:uridine kinase
MQCIGNKSLLNTPCQSASMPASANKLVVSVFGPSGAGKSTLSRALAAAYGEAEATTINGDYYSEDLGDRCPSELRADFALLATHLSQPVGTVCACPDYDFHACRRIAVESGWNRFTIRPVVFVDHM